MSDETFGIDDLLTEEEFAALPEDEQEREINRLMKAVMAMAEAQGGGMMMVGNIPVINGGTEAISRRDLPKRDDVIDRDAAVSIAYAVQYDHDSLVIIPFNSEMKNPDGHMMCLHVLGETGSVELGEAITALVVSYVEEHNCTGYWVVFGCWLGNQEAHPNHLPSRWGFDADGDLVMVEGES